MISCLSLLNLISAYIEAIISEANIDSPQPYNCNWDQNNNCKSLQLKVEASRDRKWFFKTFFLLSFGESIFPNGCFFCQKLKVNTREKRSQIVVLWLQGTAKFHKGEVLAKHIWSCDCRGMFCWILKMCHKLFWESQSWLWTVIKRLVLSWGLPASSCLFSLLRWSNLSPQGKSLN